MGHIYSCSYSADVFFLKNKIVNCKIYQTCPFARNCSVIQEAEFCGYHQQNMDNKGISVIDFEPVEDDTKEYTL
jgi:hypothetical protein